MANWYHFAVKTLGKNKGRSAVQFSAYMAGTTDYNRRTHEHYNHTSKEEVAFCDMRFSSSVPVHLQERSRFWNEVELNEKSDNARFSRTFELALDKNATLDQMISQVESFATSLMRDGYCAVQYAIHLKDGNPHAHLMVPTRQMINGEWAKAKEIKGYVCKCGEQERTFKSAKDIPEGWERIPLLDENGEQKKDSRNRLQWKRATIVDDVLNSKDLLLNQRERWANILNSYLSPEQQVSHLSYKARGLDIEPTRHLGYVATKMERDGRMSELGDENRAIRARNILPKKQELETNIIERQSILAKLEKMLRELLDDLKHFVRREPRKSFFEMSVDDHIKQTDIVLQNRNIEQNLFENDLNDDGRDDDDYTM